MMKVARKHIIAAIENPGKMTFFTRYAIKAKSYVGQDKRTGEFGWTIAVVPSEKK